MKLIFLFLFTLICKPGTIIRGDDFQMSLIAPEKSSYYFFEDIELEAGSYCYISDNQDTTWFFIEHSKLYYTFPKQKWNNEQIEVADGNR